MKIIIKVAIAVGILVIACLFFYWLTSRGKAEEVYVNHSMVVQQIEGLGKLEVVKYTIQDIMDLEKSRRWLPNSKTSLKVVGEVIACIDLTKVTKDDIYSSKDSVSLLLPLPEICHYKVDHSKSSVYNIDFGLWETTQLVDEAYRRVEVHLYNEALKMGIADESRANTIKVLTPILQALGFKRIYIGFKTPQQSEQNMKLQPAYRH